METNFYTRYQQICHEKKSLLCIALDPDIKKIPSVYYTSKVLENKKTPVYIKEAQIDIIEHFLCSAIDASIHACVAYKLNTAFYEALGSLGFVLFERIVNYIKKQKFETLIIADAKRGDIGNTAEQYAIAFFETFACDAITLSPYMGLDTLEPFLAYTDKASMLLCLTSNAGSRDFQIQPKGNPLYLEVAKKVATINQKNAPTKIWLVVGATHSPELHQSLKPYQKEIPFLVPGIGHQGGSIKETIASLGTNTLLVVGRSFLYETNTKDSMDIAQYERLFDMKVNHYLEDMKGFIS